MIDVSKFRQRANRRFYRLLYRAYRAAFRTAPPRRLRATELRRALIIRHDAVGDLIVTTPILSFLADVAPQAEVDVLASRSNHSLIAADRRVRRAFISPTSTRQWIVLLRRLRTRDYDVVYSLRYGRALQEGIISSLAATRTTQKVSVFRPKRYHGLFTRLVRTPRHATHMAERLLHVVAASLEASVEQSEVSLSRYPMRLAITPEAEMLAADFLSEHRVANFAVVNFSAREPDRDWPLDACARVITELAAAHGDLTFVLIAPAARRDEASAIVAASATNRLLIFPPTSDLLAIAALVRRARLIVTPDTAAVHIASATECPVVGLYAQLKTRLWTPYGVPYRLVQAPAGSPIAAIPSAAIVSAFEALYAETAARPADR